MDRSDGESKAMNDEWGLLVAVDFDVGAFNLSIMYDIE